MTTKRILQLCDRIRFWSDATEHFKRTRNEAIEISKTANFIYRDVQIIIANRNTKLCQFSHNRMMIAIATLKTELQ